MNEHFKVTKAKVNAIKATMYESVTLLKILYQYLTFSFLIISKSEKSNLVDVQELVQCTLWKSKTRVTCCELQVQIYELRVQIHESRVPIYELRVEIHDLRLVIHELRVEIYELRVEIHELRVQMHELGD